MTTPQAVSHQDTTPTSESLRSLSQADENFSGFDGSIASAFAICEKMANTHYENFPVASVLLPKKLRPHVAAVYAFARTADDYADEARYSEVRMAKLKTWEQKLSDLSEERAPTHPVFIALAQTLKEFNIPVQYFHDLLTAFKMDVVVSRYKTFDQVLGYCKYSANPVGRIMLHLFGLPVPKLMEYSDSICTGLQLANFWQDVAVDVEKNRVYLPQEDMLKFGYTESFLFEKKYSDQFKRLMAFQVERTEAIFREGKKLLPSLRGRFGFEIRLTWLGGMTILKKIRQANGNVFDHRPQLTKMDFITLFFKACFF